MKLKDVSVDILEELFQEVQVAPNFKFCSQDRLISVQ